MLREFHIPVVKIQKKGGCDNNPTTIPWFNYRHMLSLRVPSKKRNCKNDFFVTILLQSGTKYLSRTLVFM